MTAANPPVSTYSSACTCFRLRKASRQLTNMYDHALAPYGLTVTQFSLLGHLRALPGISVGRLARLMAMDPTTLKRALAPLQRRRLVQAHADPEDRRSRVLTATDAGQELYLAARPGWEQAQQQVETALAGGPSANLNFILDDLLARLRSTAPPAQDD